MKLREPTQDNLQAFLIKLVNFSSWSQEELKWKGMGPRFAEVESTKEIGLWYEAAEGKEKEAGRRYFCRKEVLT